MRDEAGGVGSERHLEWAALWARGVGGVEQFWVSGLDVVTGASVGVSRRVGLGPVSLHLFRSICFVPWVSTMSATGRRPASGVSLARRPGGTLGGLRRGGGNGREGSRTGSDLRSEEGCQGRSKSGPL